MGRRLRGGTNGERQDRGLEPDVSASSRDGAHGERVLLVDAVQLVCAHGVGDEVKLLGERLEAVCHTDVRDVGAPDVIALRTFSIVTGAKPVALYLWFEKTFK